MLSDEEKEALQYFNTETKTEAMHYGAVLVKLIEKQSKEIEELKEKNNKLMEELDLTTVYISGVYDGEKKVEGKIKAKIDYLLKQYDSENFINFEMFIKILQSLLDKE